YRAMWREGEELYKEFREVAKHYLEDIGREKISVPGVGKLYYTARDGRRTFDDKALAAHRPLDYDNTRKVLIGAKQAFCDLAGVTEDPEAWADAVLKSLALDLSRFEKQGQPYRDFRTYPAKEER
ncbi:hypothetical protein LCGC14_1902860, partial [marine sediment metagenome]